MVCNRWIILVMFLMTIFVNPCNAAPNDDPYYRVIYNEVMYQTRNQDYAHFVTKNILYGSDYYKVDPLLIAALFKQESGFRMEALSPTGAIGIAQLQPTTAQGLGFNPYDATQNIEGGIRYLAMQLKRFSYMGDWAATYAIAAYNAGPGSIYDNGGELPPYNETRNHVNRITEIYVSMKNAL